jgi:hypothetical protein
METMINNYVSVSEALDIENEYVLNAFDLTIDYLSDVEIATLIERLHEIRVLRRFIENVNK